ncbi:hypothetical protein BJ980_001153 [Nocardioides daedukensis]|uniref:Uncharacterized protein n=1 Tax=Nocardioides daedukensis TaxID=634462 RepID=A0A7Y9UVP2_9ACTN|nr:hypothetical protein [Nocardioides daedukensis]NYG58230.1 hypothetical protein [Nocardioides daedukensis]
MPSETCPRCQTPRESPDLAFCTNCGTPFAAGGSQPPVEEDRSTQVLPQQPWDQQGSQPGWGAQQGSPGGSHGGGNFPPPGAQQGQWGGPAQPPAGGWSGAAQPPQGQWGGAGGGPGHPGGPWQQQGPDGGGRGRGKIALIIGLVVVLLAAIGITLALVLGGDDKDAKDAPTNASKDEFCEVAEEYGDLEDDEWEDASDIADEAAEVGTPEDIPEDARRGFLVALEILGEAKDEEDAERLSEDRSAADQKDLTAFFMYVGTTCAAEPGVTQSPSGLPSDLPSDLPTDLPSDLPTPELPSDFLTDLPSDLLSDLPSELLTLMPETVPSN